jgi:integrase/recombinase XerD
VNDLVSAGAAPVRDPDGERRAAELKLVHDWLSEQSRNTRLSYADAIGYPFHPSTIGQDKPWPPPQETFRDTQTLRNGVTWVQWTSDTGRHMLDVKRADVVAWAEALREEPHPETGDPLTRQTRGLTFTAASSFYRWLVEEGHIEYSPFLQVNRKKLEVEISQDNSPTRRLTLAEAAKLQWAADNDPQVSLRLRHSALVALLYRLGPRVSEVINADVEDILLMEGVRVLRVTLKGGRVHFYKIPKDVWARLEPYLLSRGIGTTVAKQGQAGGRTPLLVTASGGRLDRSNVTAVLQRLAEFGGIEEPSSVSPHTARHTLINALRKAGYSDEEIAKIVGHKSTTTTGRYGDTALQLVNSPLDTANEMYEQALVDLPEKTT